MLAFTIIWLVSVVAAVVVGNRIPWWLTWRLFLFVPLFGEIALLWSPLTNLERPLTLTILAEPNTWFWFVVFYVFGLIQYGPIAIVLGGLGSLIVKAKQLPVTISRNAFILAAAFAGALVGGSFQFAYGTVLGLRLPTIEWIWFGEWVFASIFGGAAGGFIVAYYAAKMPSNEREEEGPELGFRGSAQPRA